MSQDSWSRKNAALRRKMGCNSNSMRPVVMLLLMFLG